MGEPDKIVGRTCQINTGMELEHTGMGETNKARHGRVHNVVLKRKENCRTSLEEEEGSVIFHGSNSRNSSPSPTATIEQVQMTDAIRALLTTDPWELFFGIIEPTYLELTMELYLTFHLQTVLTSRHIHFSPSKCWHTLAPSTASYNSSRSKASVLPPSLRYLHAILAHTITGSHCDSAPDGATSKGGHLHWPLRDQAGATLWAPQHRGPRIIPHPHRPDEAYEDIPDDVPPQHEDPPTQPPPPSCPVHAAASYANISERLTRFEKQCFQRFQNIDATLQQICQHLHISSPVPPRKPSSDEDDLWPSEPLRPPEYPPPLSNRFLPRTPASSIHYTLELLFMSTLSTKIQAGMCCIYACNNQGSKLFY
ncbi:hypothetical protein GOBAR_AA25308 [Gossypium barbadense]|uniref:Uncharacterized protein n=1 Tax=Gossypium barbadense TaxID=3634 RepID=A0A2P5WW90_GOSBA|nr:hypothetical protein GOBAR_AA25308 [Gossypium barbadense]